jgi:hypothetical protein
MQEETMSPMPLRALARPLFNGLAVALCCAALITSGAAMAATKKTTQASGKKRPAKVTFIEAPSSESPAARKKRLKRECKGRPNAGACLGHTR